MSRRRRKQPKGVSRINGYVYVLEISIEDKIVYKVGATQNSVRRRVLNVIESMEKVYGYFPKVVVLCEEKCRNYYQVETSIHKMLEDCVYEPSCSWSGSSECFVGKEAVIDAYRKGLAESDVADEDNTFTM